MKSRNKGMIMTNKSSTLPVGSASNDAFSELEQLRLLVFGQAKQQLDQRIDELQQRVSDELDMQQKQFNERFSEMSTHIEQQHQAVLANLAELNNTQETDKAELIEANKTLSSQLEMTENASKDDFVAMQKRIDHEVNQLESGLDKAKHEILAQLEQVTKELSGSKTDRKKLALLLANMASNLDADD